MKRICIYVTYDLENIVDEYVGYMLRELRKVTDYLVVVCNYDHISKGIENVQPYADKIFYRKNIGFDAGAYKDALCKYLGWDMICGYDELLLINDSFYGPLYPIEDLFKRMNRVDTDYWGIVRCPQGVFDDGYAYGTHIQSYFLTFRKNILENKFFRGFWEALRYPETLYQAVREFEIGCNIYLTQIGFRGTALTDLYKDGVPHKENEIPYMQYSLELIRDLHIPILKRRSLYLTNRGFANALYAFRYIEEKTVYDAILIKKHLMRISQLDYGQGMLNLQELTHFYNDHKKIFFYGAGVYGQNLAILFNYFGWTFKGFFVTDSKSLQENCEVFRDVKLDREDGVIITVGNKEMCLQILKMVEERCDKKHIFCPSFL